mmetsp:Transcript_6543/g.14276  ORF Transcript_6543/g.14276 Transcript_6543/m.14276 type:complete len:82 (+) Transcript_6543:76-321(+)
MINATGLLFSQASHELSTTTTTAITPGLPWWAWFLVCCGLFAICFLCCGGLSSSTSDLSEGSINKKKEDAEMVFRPHEVVI